MSDEKLISALNEARMLNAAENVIYPVIEDMIQKRISLACSEYRAGKVDALAHIAYIAGLKDLSNQLKAIQTKGNQANIKLLNKQD